jgi:hypothetical protein
MICDSCRDYNFFTCENCEEIEHTDNRFIPEGTDANLCEGCYDSLPTCSECGDTTFETIEIDDEGYCESCARACGERIVEEIRDRDYDVSGDVDEDDELLADLMDRALALNLFGIATRQWICTECNSSYRCQLPSLNTWDMSHFVALGITSSRCRACTNGEPIIESALRTSYRVLSYSHKPVPDFRRTERDLEKRALHFGTEVEIEMHDRNDSRRVALAQIGEDDQQHKLFYCKSDSCITNGFELVSHPFTFDWMNQHRDAFDAMFKLAKLMRGFESPGCGMHIHMSSDAFTNLHLFKFMRWFYTNRGFIRAIARRPKGKLDEWASMEEPEPKKLLKYSLDKRNGLGLGRAALNLGQRSTIECRIFRSTLSPTGYYGNIEFLQSLFDYTKNSGVKDTGFTPYIEFVKERGQSYKNFLNLTETIRPMVEQEGE